MTLSASQHHPTRRLISYAEVAVDEEVGDDLLANQAARASLFLSHSASIPCPDYFSNTKSRITEEILQINPRRAVLVPRKNHGSG